MWGEPGNKAIDRMLCIPYSGKLSREKTFANWWKYDFRGLFAFAVPKDTTPQISRRKLCGISLDFTTPPPPPSHTCTHQTLKLLRTSQTMLFYYAISLPLFLSQAFPILPQDSVSLHKLPTSFDSNGKLPSPCQERTSAISFTLETWELVLQWVEWQFLGRQRHLKGHRKTKPVIDTSLLSAQTILSVPVRTVQLLKQALQVVSRAFCKLPL